MTYKGWLKLTDMIFFKKNWKKSCPSAVISLYMSRFSWIREFLSYLKGVKRTFFHRFLYLGKKEVANFFLEIGQFFTQQWMFEYCYFSIVPNKVKNWSISKKFFWLLCFCQNIKSVIKIHSFWRLLSNLEIPLFN